MADSLVRELRELSLAARKSIFSRALPAVIDRMRAEAKKGELSISEQTVMDIVSGCCLAGSSGQLVDKIIFDVFDALEARGCEREIVFKRFSWTDDSEVDGDESASDEETSDSESAEKTDS